jgi:hypothetical protein
MQIQSGRTVPLISFLRQTDKFISTGVMPSQKFWQCGDDINTKDDITPFDGTDLGPSINRLKN